MAKKINIETRRHSGAHVLAMAVLDFFPEVKFGTGPATENGFYYDFFLPRNLIPEDIDILEKKMLEIAKSQTKFEKQEISINEAKKIFTKLKQNLKLELIEKIEKIENQKTITIYKSGDFIDLCAGPHVEHTGQIGVFSLKNFSAVYWQGDNEKESMQRIYATSFASEKEMRRYERTQEKIKKNDHRLIGKNLNLFSFHEEGQGFPFWHEKGTIIFNKLQNILREKNEKNGYEEIKTPVILSSELWHKSGHFKNYSENMYFLKIDDRDFAVKPMNCPGGLLIFREKNISYRDLPFRVGEFGLCHRHELSGVLHGLFRVRSFTMDDAHIFCQEKDIKSEIIKIINETIKIYKIFGFETIKIFLATKPKKAIGSEEIWEKATNMLTDALKDKNLDFEIKKGEGAFYGPKIEFNIADCFGRNWQCGTIQIDFSMPQRFELEYTGIDGKKHRPIMIHRAILGSLERFIGILIENNSGNLPFFISPVQAMIIPIAKDFHKYANFVKKKLEKKGYRIKIDEKDESLSKKIRNSELQKIPFILIVGEKEEKNECIAVRKRHTKKQETLTIKETCNLFLEKNTF